jgi:hypothetical protein
MSPKSPLDNPVAGATLSPVRKRQARKKTTTRKANPHKTPVLEIPKTTAIAFRMTRYSTSANRAAWSLRKSVQRDKKF